MRNHTVDNNPERFKKEPTIVSHLNIHDTFKGNGNDAFWFQFCSSNKIDLRKKVAIERAIESIINAE